MTDDDHHLDVHVTVYPARVGWWLTVWMRGPIGGRSWPRISRRWFLTGWQAMRRAHSWSPKELTVVPRTRRIR